jgi:glycosyltransferase involved in cell wall biosynthesis
MKIIFCLHHFLPEFIAGTEIYTLRLAQHLKNAGSEVLIVIPFFDHSISDEYIYEGIRVIRYAEESIEDRNMIMGKSEPEGLLGFIKILNIEKPDIIHFHELAPGRGVSIFHVEKAYQLKIPIVLTFHLSYYTCIKGSLIYKEKAKCDGIIRVGRCTECIYQSKNITGVKAKWLSKIALGFFKANINLTSLNNSLGTALGFPFIINKIKCDLLKLSTFASKIVVIANWYGKVLEENGVPADKLIIIKQGLTNGEIRSNEKKKVFHPLKVVFLGRISELKGLHLLIDAVCALPGEKITLHIYGQETDKPYAEFCRRKSLNKNNIVWAGVISPEMVHSTLSRYDILCLPSTFSEMSPLVIQEAFAAGIPVIASDVYGNAEQINDGVNGWLFRFKDSSDLAQKLQFLIENISMIDKSNLNLPKANHFKNVAEQHLAMYSVLSNN